MKGQWSAIPSSYLELWQVLVTLQSELQPNKDFRMQLGHTILHVFWTAVYVTCVSENKHLICWLARIYPKCKILRFNI